ncbi:hypothetical protein AAHE18_08G157400 [Arachis hypogaea]|uniref:Uncharacterized protein n=1 Tax=Arachis hypogaea TaxID=3818 RepID=A0A445BY30_ARAHY|nr:hypothetical protein Ahy_A08g039943 [Arachis hypogaea]
MSRELVEIVDGTHNSGGALSLLGMFFLSLWIISMVIFSCGDDDDDPRRRRGGRSGLSGLGGDGGGADGGGGGGGGGGFGGG